jgi:LysR family malonate utilization transcriptional regulator
MRSRIDEQATFRKLEVLLAFLETGNLAKTAEALDLSTVSVHRALHSLEQGVRCTLFRHEGRNLNPNAAAYVLADAAVEVIKLMEDGIRATREAAGYSSDRLKLGALHSLTFGIVPDMVIDMRVRRPALGLDLVLGPDAELLEKLRQGEIDAALMALPDPDPEVESVPLFEDEIFFAAPIGSPYAKHEAINLCDFRHESFVTLSDGFVTYRSFLGAFRVADFTPYVAMTTGDIFSLMNLVRGGIGYTLLPGRVRGKCDDTLQLIPLQPRFRMRHTIGLNFMRARERDPNLLALAAVCRLSTRGFRSE